MAHAKNHHHHTVSHSGRSSSLGRTHGKATGRAGANGAKAKSSTKRASPRGKPAKAARIRRGTVNSKAPWVFVNFPFHERNERLFCGFVAALVCVGLPPRIVAKMPAADPQRQIYELLKPVQVQLHEMSYVQRDLHQQSGFRVPRFNMPYELGMASSASKHNGHEFFVFERKKYRLLVSLSDLSVDPHIHHGTAEGAILAILDVFGRRGSPATPQLIKKVFTRLYREYREIRRTHGWIFRSYCFQECVYLATVIFADLTTPKAGRP